MKTIVLSVFVMMTSTLAIAAPPQGGCRLSYHADSAGRGIEAGYFGTNQLPVPGDKACYDLGVAEGQALLQDHSQRCDAEFQDGKANGFAASGNAAGNDCYAKGYIAGFALLGVSARAGSAPSACVKEYRRGNYDGKNALPPTPLLGYQENACYMTGLYDASQL